MYHSNPIAEGLKNIMRGLPVPLTIITANNGRTKRGITVSSFTTLSVNPPMVTFNIDCGSQFCRFFDTVEKFAIHFPSRKHTDLCRLFATSGLTAEEQFRDITYYENEDGTPVLSEITSYIYCEVREKIRVGDHYIFIGTVEEIHHPQEDIGLLYLNKVFRSLEVG